MGGEKKSAKSRQNSYVHVQRQLRTTCENLPSFSMNYSKDAQRCLMC